MQDVWSSSSAAWLALRDNAESEGNAAIAPFHSPDQNMKRRMLTLSNTPTPIIVVTMLVPP